MIPIAIGNERNPETGRDRWVFFNSLLIQQEVKKMPIYEYTCRSCGSVSEILTSIGGHSDPLQCKKCGSADLDKLLSAPSIGNAGTSGSDCSTQEKCYSPSCSTKPGGG